MSHHETTDVPLDEAVASYLEARQIEWSDQTIQADEYRLGHFTRFCNEIEDVTTGELTPKLLHDYRLWRKEDGDLNLTSLHTQLSTLCVFIKWYDNHNYVVDGLGDWSGVIGPSSSTIFR